ncbi:MAG: CLI_3235 family bacteriocin precursor [Clostridia bacterium]|nr:CLI_3235 family bacteriocin precursor [Clostridia bacterium]
MKKLGKKLVETKKTIQAYSSICGTRCAWCAPISVSLSGQVYAGYTD